MHWLTEMLHKYPELAVFAALGIGYWIGNFRVAGFSLGGVTGSLLAGIFVGWLFEVPVSGPAKSLVFLLFLFGIGYEVGPRFLTALKGDGWRFAVLGVFVPLVGLLVAWAVASYLKLDPGFAAGMMSGALTQSPAMGTATDAISTLDIDAGLKAKYIANVGIADALCYIFGALGVIVFCSELAPRLLKIDMKQAALALEAKYGMQRSDDGYRSAWQPHETRAYRVQDGGRAVGMDIHQVEHAASGVRLHIHRLRRGGQLLAAGPGLRLQAGDVLAVTGRREVLVNLLGARAEEVEDSELLSIPLVSYEVFLTNGHVNGRTLAELSGIDALRGVFLRKILRRGIDIPMGTQYRARARRHRDPGWRGIGRPRCRHRGGRSRQPHRRHRLRGPGLGDIRRRADRLRPVLQVRRHGALDRLQRRHPGGGHHHRLRAFGAPDIRTHPGRRDQVHAGLRPRRLCRHGRDSPPVRTSSRRCASPASACCSAGRSLPWCPCPPGCGSDARC